MGIVDSYAMHDAFHRREKSARKLAGAVFDRQSEEAG
jgi:hypothetical protein